MYSLTVCEMEQFVDIVDHAEKNGVKSIDGSFLRVVTGAPFLGMDEAVFPPAHLAALYTHAGGGELPLFCGVLFRPDG